MDQTAKLAKSITKKASKQTYYTARYMVDRNLVDDFFRAYAYFRWMDDMIDESLESQKERISFIKRQKELIDVLYQKKRPNSLNSYEEIMAVLIEHDQKVNSKLQSFIRNMFAIVEFDAYRKWQIITEKQLEWYTNCVAKSTTDGLQYFIGNNHQYPIAENQYFAAKAAHIVHLLRDTVEDLQNGFINVPKEYIELYGIDLSQIDSAAFRAWVRERTAKAREYFMKGKHYLETLDILRCKTVGLWYCARFESILDKIEKENYLLKSTYEEKGKTSRLIKMAQLTLVAPFKNRNSF
ncbi:squalene/phytoene synthase family protein [Muricauda sp. JGD-17]|uniref:Squalene/phytoene synthase family protein n=1 Tax=Flagellimonas ochracea TaxID=2696472 RepID=A0A964WXT0_9FLAO|nr:squalene/phytoene synthase family protein [Allomuricauda ochracea]NAY92182.1 squalene/phytoene synthase family protein [Allomuricauda ochracea]